MNKLGHKKVELNSSMNFLILFLSATVLLIQSFAEIVDYGAKVEATKGKCDNDNRNVSLVIQI